MRASMSDRTPERRSSTITRQKCHSSSPARYERSRSSWAPTNLLPGNEENLNSSEGTLPGRRSDASGRHDPRCAPPRVRHGSWPCGNATGGFPPDKTGYCTSFGDAWREFLPRFLRAEANTRGLGISAPFLSHCGVPRVPTSDPEVAVNEPCDLREDEWHVHSAPCRYVHASLPTPRASL